ncbi:hypothetical protein KQX54_010936 [Cotesia glomerata]|uniref:Uncharacterized protein n=1 Tax=Cotesia glomerata TaxID=32391 RepID=A0AAV7IA30_COTGL|nr:hypothetical protein KQX54_010936 [Cotesia glomerata]
MELTDRHTAKECPQIVQSDIYREVVDTEKLTDNFREPDSDTGYESSTSESGKSTEKLEIQIEQKVIDRFTEPAVEAQDASLQKREPAVETQNTSLQKKLPVVEVRKTSLQNNDVVDAPKTRRGRPRKHRAKLKERRISPHEVTPLLDPDIDSEPDSAIGEDSSSESDGSIADSTYFRQQISNEQNRQPDDKGLQIQKLSDTRLKSRFTDTRQVYWKKKTNANHFGLAIHELGARPKSGKPTVKLKRLLKKLPALTAIIGLQRKISAITSTPPDESMCRLKRGSDYMAVLRGELLQRDHEESKQHQLFGSEEHISSHIDVKKKSFIRGRITTNRDRYQETAVETPKTSRQENEPTVGPYYIRD